MFGPKKATQGLSRWDYLYNYPYPSGGIGGCLSGAQMQDYARRSYLDLCTNEKAAQDLAKAQSDLAQAECDIAALRANFAEDLKKVMGKLDEQEEEIEGLISECNEKDELVRELEEQILTIFTLPSSFKWRVN
jgi:hypothetical protein